MQPPLEGTREENRCEHQQTLHPSAGREPAASISRFATYHLLLISEHTSLFKNVQIQPYGFPPVSNEKQHEVWTPAGHRSGGNLRPHLTKEREGWMLLMMGSWL